MSGEFAQPLAVTAVGAVSAVGTNTAQTCTSIRAGLAGFHEHPLFESLSNDPEWEDGEPLVVGAVPGLNPLMEGRGRLLDLAIPALLELGREAKLKRTDLADAALLLALPALDESVQQWGVEDAFIHELCSITGLTGFKLAKKNHSGHTGMFELLATADKLIQSGQCRYCILLGVDSYLSLDRMELWDDNWRFRSDRNVDGFIPGEGACALLVESTDHAKSRGAKVLVTLNALGVADEENAQDSEKSSSGDGLRGALQSVIPAGNPARWICCDLNGESYRAFEWGVAQVKFHQGLDGTPTVHHPAESTGDLGAATGGMLLSHVAYAMGRPRPPADEAVLWTSADSGRRAAIRVSRAETD